MARRPGARARRAEVAAVKPIDIPPRVDSGEKCQYCKQVWVIGRFCEGCGMPANKRAEKPTVYEGCQRCNRGRIIPIIGGRGVCNECGSHYVTESRVGFVPVDAVKGVQSAAEDQ